MGDGETFRSSSSRSQLRGSRSRGLAVVARQKTNLCLIVTPYFRRFSLRHFLAYFLRHRHGAPNSDLAPTCRDVSPTSIFKWQSMEPSVNVTRRISMPQILEDPDALTGLSDKDDGLIQVAANRADDPVVQQLVHRSTFPVATEKVPKEVRNLVAGGMAGMVAKTVVAPLERIKILFQISSVPFRLLQVPVVAKNIIKDEGALALWKGNTATMLRVFPYSGIQFMTFDRVKSYYLHLAKNDPERRHKFGGLTPVESLIAGMIAGTVSVICTYPLDLTRAQLAVRRKHKHEYNLGFRGVLKQTYSLYGFSGLYRGITPTVLGILPYSGFAFALNEQAKREVSVSVAATLRFWVCLCSQFDGSP